MKNKKIFNHTQRQPNINSIYLNGPNHRPILQHTRVRRTYTEDGKRISQELIDWFNNSNEKDLRIQM